MYTVTKVSYHLSELAGLASQFINSMLMLLLNCLSRLVHNLLLLCGWLRKRARRSKSCVLIGPSCLLRISRFVTAKAKFFGVIFWPYNKSLLTKLVRSRWLDIGLVVFFFFFFVFFFTFIDLDFISVHKNRKKKLDQYPAILTSCLVNNAHVFRIHCFDGPEGTGLQKSALC